ncbi:hypothetical protein ACFOKI_02940 [Sphingomonas qilianensis]|uniref:Uncharacterized protein n=1 Tax=Sphingomonas qilianensis TaxID=1736690 RepID=A0ABU9XVG8_9SPHN
MADREDHNDLVRWVLDLQARLYTREAQYRLAKEAQPDRDPEEVRVEATVATAFALIDLHQALAALPQFAGGKGLLPLQDLAQALGDLVTGGQPVLLQRRAGVGKGKDTFGRRYIKKQAVTGVKCLQFLGYNEKAACSAVARVFSDAGVKGRKRRQDGSHSLDHGTILNWVISAPDNAEEYGQIQRFVAEWAADTKAPMTEAAVLDWARETANSPPVQSKI